MAYGGLHIICATCGYDEPNPLDNRKTNSMQEHETMIEVYAEL